MTLRRLILLAIWAVAALGITAPASAVTLAVKAALGPPGWVLPYQPGLQFDFARGAAWKGTGTGGGAVVPPESLLTVVRASTCMIDNLAGNWGSFPSNTLCRSDKGATVWEVRTNLALWCRDLTNAAWAKVTMTTALTASGIDGAANSATTITATGALSTVLQTVVQLSTADTVSFFVRRRTGTGTVEITADGAAFTDITAAIATAATATPGGWYRAAVSATLVNPVLGLRITTSGDAVDVDFGQLEAGTFATSPILTTTVAVARAADVVTVTRPPVFGGVYSLFAKGTPKAPTTYGVNQTLLSVDDGTNTNRSQINRNLSSGATTSFFAPAGINVNPSGTWAQDTSGKFAVAFAASDQAAVFNAGTPATNGSGTPVSGSTLTMIHIGSRADGVVQWNGYIERIAVWPTTRLPNEVLRDLTR